MQRTMLKIALIGISAGLLSLPLGGCAKKTVMVDPAEQTAKVEDTVSAGAPAGKGGDTIQTSPLAGTENLVVADVSDAAGASEPLDTPSSVQGGLAGQAGDAAVVEGSRTTVGMQPVYFDFDSSVIRQDQLERMEANARFIKDNPGFQVRIEGNCDERGTNEYNLALGERRATSAMKYLLNLGIEQTRLSILSYGEERPLKTGNDEVAWVENRRDDFVVVR